MSKDKLLPCPFCGGEAELKQYQSGDWQVICYHDDGCIMLESDLDNCYWDNVQTLARQWNARACGQCDSGAVPMTEEAMAAHGWVRERTCHIEERGDDWYCDACDEMVGTCDTASELYIDGNAIELWNYCPNCGAKVEHD